ncbi:MAGUK p55 subfamily member 7 isoform X12 [Canis lupus familiaris]|uniref:MAGUK p55 subfamily member 7 isoform X12 n=1 Tax=Canis lupus familiaris TaxID=9615 RepID=UPI0018F4D694|nr:MAGUK p55 subfamily member 7 isoform X12 [Canis lupus familiaris]
MGHMRDHGSCNAGRHKAGTEVLQRGCHQLEGRSQRSKRCGNSQGCSKVDGLCTPFLNGRPAQRPWGHALPSPAQPRPGSSRRLRPRPWPSTCSRDHATGMQRGRLSSARPAGSVPGLVDFEDKEQVKAFLENVVECKYQCYCEKDPNGLYELLAVLPVQLGPRVDSQEDLTFLWDMFGEKSLHSLIHEKLHYYEKQNPVPILHGAAVLADDLAEELQNKPLNSEIRELLKLLSKPNVKALLSVHDTVAQKNYDPVLPPMPDDIDDEEDSVKIIRLVKNREPLGATIKKDEQTGAIVVARIMRGGAADRSGLIHVGDELREVNGIPVEDKRPEEIIQILAQSQGAITFKIIPSIKEETPSKEGKMFIKALFDYNPNEDKAIPCKEAGLSFKKGDILQIMSQDDATWWQAKHAGDANPRAGLIPSKHFQERRLALRRPEILVQPFKVSSRKSCPVGVGLNELKRKLLISDTQHYGVTVPHTTRAKRSQESDGVEYIFISKHLFETDVQNNKFIEYGEYKNNYYGTSIDSVRSVLAKNKVCLLDVQPHTVKHLRTLEFKPYVIFIKPPSIERLRETRKNAKIISSRDDQGAAKPFTEEDFQDMIKSAQIMENQYGHLFDKIIVNDDLTVAFNELKTTFDKLETEAHWVPVSWLHS